MASPLAVLALLVLAGCGQAPQGDQFAGMASGSPSPDRISVTPDSCLLLVWDAARPQDAAFDKANDIVEGGSISCATGSTAGQFEQTLSSARQAADTQDMASLVAMSAEPLLYIDARGERHEYPDRNALSVDAASVFAPEILTVFRTAQLTDLTVAPQDGAFLALGTVWLSVPATGAAPQIRTINLQAAAEAEAQGEG